jgi:hypothetical protein
MSGSVCFEPISKSALYQGTTSVVPKRASRTRALAPAALFSLSVRLPAAFGRSTEKWNPTSRKTNEMWGTHQLFQGKKYEPSF